MILRFSFNCLKKIFVVFFSKEFLTFSEYDESIFRRSGVCRECCQGNEMLLNSIFITGALTSDGREHLVGKVHKQSDVPDQHPRAVTARVMNCRSSLAGGAGSHHWPMNLSARNILNY